MDSLCKDRLMNLEEFTLLAEKTLFHKDPKWKDYYLLMQALRYGQKDIVKLLIQRGARVNRFISDSYFDICNTPLHLAVTLGCPEIVGLLLSKGADINLQNNNGETPLIIAVQMGKYSVVDLLLSSDKLENRLNRECLSHLHIACMMNRVDVVKRLLQDGGQIINEAVEMESMNWPGYTSLHFAVQFQCIETVQFLLSHNADITAKAINDSTPLHLANTLRNEAIMDMILSAHKYEATNPVNSSGLSHFHIACTRNDPTVVERFLQQRVDVDMAVSKDSLNWPEYRPINFAIEYECAGVVKLLLAHNVDLNFCSNFYRPIQYAHGIGNKVIIDLLLSKSKIKESSTTGIDTLSDFHTACIQNNVDLIRESLQTGNLKNKPVDVNLSVLLCGTPLHMAVKHNNVEMASLLAGNGADITIRDARGKTPLHLAFENEKMDIVDSIPLVHLNINRNPVNDVGLSHFHIFCSGDRIEIIKRFLQTGVNINSPVHFDSAFWPGYTPLHFAVESAQVHIVEFLLQHNADITAKNKAGSTPLEMAIEKNSLEVIELILSAASLNNIDSFDDQGFSLLHVHCYKNHISAVENFLNLHPNEIDKCVSHTAANWAGYTPLHFAVYFDHREIIDLLLKKGADSSVKSVGGSTPWHLVRPDSYYGNNDIVTMCNDENPVASNGYSHFHIACRLGNAEAVKYFLNKGVDVNEPTAYSRAKFCLSEENRVFTGLSPLHVAIWDLNVCEEVIELLLKNGANVDARDDELHTPLHHTAYNGRNAAAQILLNHGADINARNMYGETPLVRTCCCKPASFFNGAEQIRFLLRNGADINIEIEEGLSLLTMLDSWPAQIRVGRVQLKVPCTIAIMKHIRKLQAIGFYVNEKNQQDYLKFLTVYEVSGHYKELDFVEQCSKEIDQLKNVKLDNYTSLYTILRRNVNEMSFHSENNALREIISSTDLHEKYPIYGFVLELQFKKGLARRPLLENSKAPLNFLTACRLPDICFGRISLFLSNEDLQNVILSAERI